MTTDETNEQDAPKVRPNETDDDDTEGHKLTEMTSDPDFGAQAPSSRKAAATPEEDDTEGHVRKS